MSDSIKDRIAADLEQAKATGKLRSDHIREIVRAATASAVAELREGSVEIYSIIKDAVSAVVENLQEWGGDAQEEITASIEGALEGVSQKQREAIAHTQAEIDRLQSQVDQKETVLQDQVDHALIRLRSTKEHFSGDLRSTLDNAIHSLQDSDELQQMRGRYAELRSQLAILRANLMSRYGEPYEAIQKHLEEAKIWYQEAQVRAKAHQEQHGGMPMELKQAEFDQKVGEAGTALAQKERQVRQILKELWRMVSSNLAERRNSNGG